MRSRGRQLRFPTRRSLHRGRRCGPEDSRLYCLEARYPLLALRSARHCPKAALPVRRFLRLCPLSICSARRSRCPVLRPARSTPRCAVHSIQFDPEEQQYPFPGRQPPDSAPVLFRPALPPAAPKHRSSIRPTQFSPTAFPVRYSYRRAASPIRRFCRLSQQLASQAKQSFLCSCSALRSDSSRPHSCSTTRFPERQWFRLGRIE